MVEGDEMAVTCIVVDNGEPQLEASLKSLRDQTVKTHIIVVGGPKTDYELAKSLADEVYGPIKGIGKARVYGVLKADSEFILSCDSDTVYFPDYAEQATYALIEHDFVKAGTVYPRRKTPLGDLEIAISYPIIPYEHILAFRKSAFIVNDLHTFDYKHPRWDIGVPIVAKLIPVARISEMKAVVNVPTRYAVWVSKVAPCLALGSTVMCFVSTPFLVDFAKNFIKKNSLFFSQLLRTEVRSLLDLP